MCVCVCVCMCKCVYVYVCVLFAPFILTTSSSYHHFDFILFHFTLKLFLHLLSFLQLPNLNLKAERQKMFLQRESNGLKHRLSVNAADVAR